MSQLESCQKGETAERNSQSLFSYRTSTGGALTGIMAHANLSAFHSSISSFGRSFFSSIAAYGSFVAVGAAGAVAG